MAPTRVLYAGQTATIAGETRPVQSASCETSIPIEDLLVLGKLGSAKRAQKEVATCKSDIKIYATQGLGSFVKTLIADASAGKANTISVSPNGFSMAGILTSFSIDASKGDFVTASMSFAGVGEATHVAPGELNTEAAPAAAAFTPMTSSEVTVAGGAGCVSTLKYSLDIPNEIVSCLGGVIAGDQAAVDQDNVMFSKPPFKSSLTIEGLAVTVDTLVKSFTIGANDGDGCIKVDITDGTIISKSFNQSAGDVGATYSLNVEGTNVTITAGQA